MAREGHVFFYNCNIFYLATNKKKMYDFEIIDTIGFGSGSSTSINKALKKATKDKTFNVRIASFGGSFFDGLEINRLFREHGNVTAYIAPFAASAATIAAMGATKIIMESTSHFLIHNVSQFVLTYGMYNKEQIREEIAKLKASADENEALDSSLLKIYSSKTGLSDKELKPILAKGIWLNAEDALKYKLVDEIKDLSIEDKSLNINNFVALAGLPPFSDDNKINTKKDGEPAKTDSKDIKSLLSNLINMIKPNKTNKPIKTVMDKNLTHLNTVLHVDGIEFVENKVSFTETQVKAIEDALSKNTANKDADADLEKLKKEVLDLSTKVSDLAKEPGATVTLPAAGTVKDGDAYLNYTESMKITADF